MSLTYLSPLDHGLDATAALLTEGFSGYFVPIQIPVAGLLGMVRQDSIDLGLSRVILDNAQPVGVALIARRGWTGRLAAMSIIPAARGQGIGAVAVNHLFQEARERGDRAMHLEVIAQNTPGVRLYTKCGFRTVRRLIGFSGQPQGDPDPALEQINVHDVARALITHGPTDLPWQISGESLALAGPPNIAYHLGDSYIALTNPAAPAIVIRAIVTLPDARRRGSATKLLRAVIAAHPDKTWRVSVTLPEELGSLFQKIGLEPEKLTQLQMTATL